MHTRFGLMLLCMSTGCPDDAGGSGTTGDGGTTNASMTSSPPTTSLGTTASSSTTSDPSASSSPTTTPGTTDATTDAASSTTGATSESAESESDSESTGGGAEACMAGCQVEVDCGPCAGGKPWKSVEACVDWCTANLAKAGAFSFACRSAWRGVHACVGALDCDGFEAWCAKDPPFAYPCYRVDVRQSFECEGQ